jgi:hypothetical protein
MAKKFSELTNKMSPERRARVEREYEQLVAEMKLATHEIAKEGDASQLEVNPSEVPR